MPHPGHTFLVGLGDEEVGAGIPVVPGTVVQDIARLAGDRQDLETVYPLLRLEANAPRRGKAF